MEFVRGEAWTHGRVDAWTHDRRRRVDAFCRKASRTIGERRGICRMSRAIRTCCPSARRIYRHASTGMHLPACIYRDGFTETRGEAWTHDRRRRVDAFCQKASRTIGERRGICRTSRAIRTCCPSARRIYLSGALAGIQPVLRAVPEELTSLKSLLLTRVHRSLHFGFDFGVEGFVRFERILRGITALSELGAFVAHP